jgi:hypothetical protein
MNHNLLTHMLFVDAIVGVGFPSPQVAEHAVKGGLATATGTQHNESWAWTRTALDELDLPTLQDLYTGLKLHEVTYAN